MKLLKANITRLTFSVLIGLGLVACGGGGSSEPALAAKIIVTGESGPAPLTVGFDGSTSEGSIASYAWNFMDEETAGGATTQHVFRAQGSYPVTLTVSDADGKTDSANYTVQVTSGNLRPTADFAWTPDTVRANREISFDASTSADADGDIASYQWTFSDGESAEGVQITHTFATPGAHEVTLLVKDGDNAKKSVTKTVTVMEANELPVAWFTLPESVKMNASAAFDGSISQDSDGEVVSYEWDFGDGETGEGPQPSHAYSSEGEKTIVLTVTDDDGESSSLSDTIQVNAANTAPVAVFSATTLSGKRIELNASGSYDDTDVTAYNWSVNQSGTITALTGENVSHTFTAEGTFQVTLTVRDAEGLQSSHTQNVKSTDGITTILEIGDSITQGTDDFPAYRYRLWKKLTEAGKTVNMVGPNAVLANGVACDTTDCPNAAYNGLSYPFDQHHAGYWGQRADQVRANLSGWSGSTPDIALIHLGTNDLIQDETVSSTSADVQDLITDLNARFSGIKIFLAQIIPINRNSNGSNAIDVAGYNASLESIASSYANVTLVNQNAAVTTGMLRDNVHPNATGEEAMATTWYNAIIGDIQY